MILSTEIIQLLSNLPHELRFKLDGFLTIAELNPYSVQMKKESDSNHSYLDIQLESKQNVHDLTLCYDRNHYNSYVGNYAVVNKKDGGMLIQSSGFFKRSRPLFSLRTNYRVFISTKI